MIQGHHLTFRREALTEALHALTAEELRVYVALSLGACPHTRRAWTTALRLGEDLAPGGQSMIPPATIDDRLATLRNRGHVHLWARGPGALRCYEVPGLVPHNEPPENLPVEPGVP